MPTNQYPVEILPNAERKEIITVKIEDLFLTRHTEHKPVWDNALSQVSASAICTPRENIRDLSTSLLGVFKVDHNAIVLTECGIQEYSNYCAPNTEVSPPTIETHYKYTDERESWFVQIGLINGGEKEYSVFDEKGNESYSKSKCIVVHTPMKWNYWHFSIRWFVFDYQKYYHKCSSSEQKKLKKRMAAAARSHIAQFATATYPGQQVIRPSIYT